MDIETLYLVLAVAGCVYAIRTMVETVLIIQDYRKEKSLEQ